MIHNQKKKYGVSKIYTGVLFALLTTHAIVTAEENKDPINTDSKLKGLEVIQVTAQKRAENVQQVPIAISAFSDAEINKLGLSNVNDLGLLTPGLETNNTTATQTSFNIRGITTNDFGIGLDAAVAVYIDGVYVGRRGTSNLSFNDVERVEVLKGPQGTLFGRNSAAGAIHIITKNATSDNEGAIKFTFGSNEKRKMEFNTNLIITEDMNFRGSVVANQRGGYLEMADSHKMYGNQDDWSMRGSLFWEAASDLDVVFRADFNKLNQQARPSISLNPGYFAPADPFSPIQTDYDGKEKRDAGGISAEINYQMDDIQFTSITSYRQFTRYNAMDDDGSSYYRASFASILKEDQMQFSQEFRLAQNSDNFKWTLGTTLFHENIEQSTQVKFTTSTLDALAIVQLQQFDPSNPPPGLLPSQVGQNANPKDLPYWPLGAGTAVVYSTVIPPATLGAIMANTGLDFNQMMAAIVASNYYKPHQEFFENEGTTNSAAVYFDGTYSVTDKFDITLGARYTYDEKEFYLHSQPNNEITIPFPGVDDIPLAIAFAPQTANQSNSWSKFTPRLVFDYQWNNDVMTYLSYSEGFKAGGFNTLGEAPPVKEETVKNTEMGMKSTWFDNQLRFNVSAYQYDYTNLQQLELIGQPVPTNNLRNVDAQGTGFEIESIWQATEDLIFTLNYGKVNTEYTNWQFFDFEIATNTGVSKLGQSISGMPEDQANARLDYYFEGLHGQFNFHVSYAYTGDRTQGIHGPELNPLPYDPVNITGLNADNTISSYGLLNTRLHWQSDNHPINMAFYVTNATDEQYIMDLGGQGMAMGSPVAMPGLPRMWGIELGMEF